MIRPQWVIGFDEAYCLVEALKREFENFEDQERGLEQRGLFFSFAERHEEGISVDGIGEWEKADALRRDIDLKYQKFIRLDTLADEQRIIEVDVFYPIREGRVESESLLTLFHLFQDLAQQRDYEVYFRTILLQPQLVYALWGGEVIEKMTPKCKREMCEMVAAIGQEKGIAHSFVVLDNQNLDDRYLNLNEESLARLMAIYIESCRRMLGSSQFKGNWYPRVMTLGLSAMFLAKKDLRRIARAFALTRVYDRNGFGSRALEGLTVQAVDNITTRLLVSYRELCFSNTHLSSAMEAPDYVSAEVEKLLQKDVVRIFKAYVDDSSVSIYQKLYLFDRFLGEVSSAIVSRISLDSYSRRDDILGIIHGAVARLLPIWIREAHLPSLEKLRSWKYIAAAGKASGAVLKGLAEWDRLVAALSNSIADEDSWEIKEVDIPQAKLTGWQRVLKFFGLFRDQHRRDLARRNRQVYLKAGYELYLALATQQYLMNVREQLLSQIGSLENQLAQAMHTLRNPKGTPSPHRLLFSIRTSEQMLKAIQEKEADVFYQDNLSNSLWGCIAQGGKAEEDFARTIEHAVSTVAQELMAKAYSPSFMQRWLLSACKENAMHPTLKHLMEDYIRPFAHFSDGNLGSRVAKHTLLVGEAVEVQKLHRGLSRIVETLFSCRDSIEPNHIVFLSEYEVASLENLSLFDVKGLYEEQEELAQEEMEVEEFEVVEVEVVEARPLQPRPDNVSLALEAGKDGVEIESREALGSPPLRLLEEGASSSKEEEGQ